MKSRAERRHHRHRMLKHAKHILKYGWQYERSLIDDKARKIANNAAVCSCSMCGNQRKHFGALTIQELKHKDTDNG